MAAILSSILVEHPLSLFYLEKTGIVDVFKELLRSYQTGTDWLNLHYQNNLLLVRILNETIQLGFPISNSSMELDPDKRRLNMYHRRFGLTIPEKKDYPGADNNDKGRYNDLMRKIIVEVCQGIIDQNAQPVTNLANPSLLS